MRKFFGLLFGFCLLSGTAFAQEPFISITDSVAGADLPVRVSGLFNDESFFVEIVRPDETKVSFEKTADEFGVTNFALDSLHLQKSGQYSLNLFREIKKNGPSSGKKFQVFPGVASPYQSKIEIKDPSVAADGEAISQIIVKAKDAFGNPIAGAKVKVFSSRNTDIVIAEKTTNQYGEIRAKVQSDTAGVSTIFTMLNDELIFEKPQIVFYLAGEKGDGLKNAGASGNGLGDFLKAQLFDESALETVAYFSIDELASEIEADKNMNVKISAKDENGDVVKNYLGMVRFSSSDDLAKLPADYQFTSEDQGVHSFYLATTFATPGNQTFAVHDLNDFRISGEQTINVTVNGGIDIQPAEAGITILTPKPGTLNSSRVTITGTVSGCDVIKVVDGKNLLVSDLTADNAGKFVFQTPGLADGLHQFEASCAENDIIKSGTVSIRIDRTPPSVVSVTVTPSGRLKPGDHFTVRVGSSEPLAAASCVFREVANELDMVGQDFAGEFTAPLACGEYPIACSVSDLLGNTLEEPNAGVVTVCQTEEPAESANTEETIKDVPPTAISNLTAEDSIDRVTLRWSPSITQNEIQAHRIVFGKCSEAFNGQNLAPGNRGTWYVNEFSDGTPLEVCATYCFKLYVIDSNNLESVASDIVQGRVQGKNGCNQEVLHPTADKKAPQSGTSTESNNRILLLSILAGMGLVMMVRRRRA